MKKIFILMSVLGVSVSMAKAQNFHKVHEMRIAVSDGSMLSVLNGLDDIFVSAVSSGLDKNKVRDQKDFLSLSAGYRKQFSNRITLGSDIAFQRTEAFTRDNTTNEKSDISKYDVIQVLPTFEYTYWCKEYIRLYGCVAVGAMLYLQSSSSSNSKDENSESVFFASQVNPIAVQIGKKFGGFAELGFGTRGIATAGLFYKF